MPNELVSEDDLTFEDGKLFHDKKGRVREVPAPLAPLADSHGHLTCFHRRDASVALCRAALAGVRLLVAPVDPTDDVTDVPTFLVWLDGVIARARKRLASCAERGLVPPAWEAYQQVPDLLDNIHLVAGAHPYGAASLDDAALARLDALLADERCVGIGEIGLDYGPYNELPPDVQVEAFRRQLRLAHERQLPVELHIRDPKEPGVHTAHSDAVRVLREEGVPEAGCDLHCFTDGPEVMQPFVELGCHIAFGGAVTFKRSDDIRAAAAACPRDLLLSETDCPFMAPVPLRGEECEPAMVAFSAACVADVREESPQETYAALWRNANGLFGLATVEGVTASRPIGDHQ